LPQGQVNISQSSQFKTIVNIQLTFNSVFTFRQAKANQNYSDWCFVEMGSRAIWFDARLLRCVVGRIKRKLTKIQILRILHSVPLQHTG